MKNTITLTLFLLAVVFGYSQEKNLTDDNGKKQGFWEEAIRGQTSYGYYKDGNKDGMWTYTNNRGTVSKVENYKDNKLDGILLEFEETYGGSVVLFEQYNQGILDGKRTEYSYNKIIGESNYNMGKLNGVKRAYYKTGGNPVLQEETYYYNDVFDGPSTWYSDKGSLLARYNFKNGEYDGEQLTYYSYDKVASREFYENGTPIGEYSEYYETGEVKLKGNYLKGVKEGNWIEYDKEGNVIKTEKYKNGLIKK